jgi:hypothetical protein
MSYREFLRLLDPKDLDDPQSKKDWYWNVFVEDQAKGFTMEEWMEGA